MDNSSQDMDSKQEDAEATKIKESKWRQMDFKHTVFTFQPTWVICVYIIVASVFIPIGLLCYTLSNSIVYQEFSPYSDVPACKFNDSNIDNAAYGQECNVTYTIEHDFKPPIYFYYKITNLYQNHRTYVQSRSDNQLEGDATDVENCDPLKSYDGKKLLPCGLIANSFFNDKFQVTHINRSSYVTELCPSDKSTCRGDETTGFWTNASWYYETTWSKSDIAWSSDKRKYINVQLTDKTTNKGSLQQTQGITLPNTNDEDLLVWMRTAVTSEFTKLHRIIKDFHFYKGDKLNVTIRNYFDSKAFQGSKSIVISTTNSLGGKNSFLGIAFMTTGGVAGFIAVILFLFAPNLNRIERFIDSQTKSSSQSDKMPNN